MNLTTVHWEDYVDANQLLFVAFVLIAALILNRYVRLRKFPYLKPFRSFVIWTAALLVILSHLGYDINTLLAGLGVGGIAVALGLQSTLESFFSSLTLLTDKAFSVGDTIKITGYEEGKVLKIGFRSTIVETAPSRVLIIPNKMLVAGVIEKKKT